MLGSSDLERLNKIRELRGKIVGEMKGMKEKVDFYVNAKKDVRFLWKFLNFNVF